MYGTTVVGLEMMRSVNEETAEESRKKKIVRSAIDTAWKYQLYPYRCLHVFTKPGKPYRRVLLAFGRQEVSCTEDNLYIEGEKHGKFTSEYISLTKEFYLKM